MQAKARSVSVRWDEVSVWMRLMWLAFAGMLIILAQTSVAFARGESLAPLAAASSIERVPERFGLFTVHDQADGIRIVLNGEVRIWLADQDGRELTLAYLCEGDVFGEIALLDGLQRAANATTTCTTECLFLPAQAVQKAVAKDPALAQHLIYSLCELLRRNLGTISSFAFGSLDARLSQVLYDLALDYANIEGNRATYWRKFSQLDLAMMLGVSREAVNKRLKDLERRGLVAFEDSKILLPDLSALAKTFRGQQRAF